VRSARAGPETRRGDAEPSAGNAYSPRAGAVCPALEPTTDL